MNERSKAIPAPHREDLESQAHLWIAEPDALAPEREHSFLLDLLTEDEQAQYRRFKVDSARRLFLTGRALARTTLSRYADVDPRDWRFSFNRHGRPEIAEPAGLPPLRFNLSHTVGRVACLVTLELDAGVDVEDSRRIERLRRLADHSFSPSEAQDVAAQPEESRRRRFFSYWTLKEAYIKARGVGISLGLSRFSFSFPEPRAIAVAFNPELEDREEEWQFQLFRASDVHLLATAIRRGARPDPALVSHRVTLPDGHFKPEDLTLVATTP